MGTHRSETESTFSSLAGRGPMTAVAALAVTVGPAAGMALAGEAHDGDTATPEHDGHDERDGDDRDGDDHEHDGDDHDRDHEGDEHEDLLGGLLGGGPVG